MGTEAGEGLVEVRAVGPGEAVLVRTGLAGVGAVSGISSWRMELMKVVGDRGVSTGRASTSRAGHTSASGLGGSSFTWTGWFSLQKAAGG